MKRLISTFAVLALVVAGVAINSPVLAHPSIDIAAANWKFTPETVTLQVGEATQLRLTSTEGVHGIKSEELGIPLTTLLPGKFETVSVTPKKAGTYVLNCAVLCGPGHEKMALTIKVEDKGISQAPNVVTPAAVATTASTPTALPSTALRHSTLRPATSRHSALSIAASNWAFTPNTGTLHVGKTTILHLASTAGVHGIESPDLGIPLTTLLPGKVVNVSVTPKKVGTYTLHCAIVCGPGHEKMTLSFKVVQ